MHPLRRRRFPLPGSARADSTAPLEEVNRATSDPHKVNLRSRSPDQGFCVFGSAVGVGWFAAFG